MVKGIWQVKDPNDLILNINGMIGCKTGSSELSKFCQSTCVKYENYILT